MTLVVALLLPVAVLLIGLGTLLPRGGFACRLVGTILAGVVVVLTLVNHAPG